jgi:hypothetical protein
MLKQITVFIENKPGRLEEVTGCLAGEGVNLHALSIADTTDFGILRMIASDAAKAERVLREHGFMVKATDVIAVAAGHEPGSLHKILGALNSPETSVEYLYAFTSRHKDYDAIVILNAGNREAAVERIRSGGFPLLDETLLAGLNHDD